MKELPRLKRGDEVELDITGSAFEGKSIGRVEGLVLFVEGAVPGDHVSAKILKTKKNLVEASVVRVLRPSPLRTEPPCPYFGLCGGCKWQNVQYEAQLRFKQQHVADSFERIGGFAGVPIQPIIGAQDIFYYRNKMEFSFSTQEWLETPPLKEDAAETEAGEVPVFLGLHVPQRYDKILDLKECRLQSEISNEILNFTRRYCRAKRSAVYSSEDDSGYLRFLVIRQSKRLKELMVNLVTRTDDAAFMSAYAEEVRREIPEITTIVNTINTRRAQIAYGEQERVYWGEGTIRERLGDHTFIISAGSFFQTNTVQAERLFEIVKVLGAFKKSDAVFDLYSGTGSIALFVSSSVQQVVGVESVASALKDAERNVSANGVTNCDFILGDLKDRLTKEREWLNRYPSPDAVILDPPRSGVHQKVLEQLLEMAPSKIVYVSCNPATQARDCRILCAEKYRLAKVQPVDMFPHTYHIENVTLLTLQ